MPKVTVSRRRRLPHSSEDESSPSSPDENIPKSESKLGSSNNSNRSRSLFSGRNPPGSPTKALQETNVLSNIAMKSTSVGHSKVPKSDKRTQQEKDKSTDNSEENTEKLVADDLEERLESESLSHSQNRNHHGNGQKKRNLESVESVPSSVSKRPRITDPNDFSDNEWEEVSEDLNKTEKTIAPVNRTTFQKSRVEPLPSTSHNSRELLNQRNRESLISPSESESDSNDSDASIGSDESELFIPDPRIPPKRRKPYPMMNPSVMNYVERRGRVSKSVFMVF